MIDLPALHGLIVQDGFFVDAPRAHPRSAAKSFLRLESSKYALLARPKAARIAAATAILDDAMWTARASVQHKIKG
jgi:hypothetical protein